MWITKDIENILEDMKKFISYVLPLSTRWQDKPVLASEPLLMPGLEPLVSQLGSWNFPIFKLVEKTQGETGCILSQVNMLHCVSGTCEPALKPRCWLTILVLSPRFLTGFLRTRVYLRHLKSPCKSSWTTSMLWRTDTGSSPVSSLLQYLYLPQGGCVVLSVK